MGGSKFFLAKCPKNGPFPPLYEVREGHIRTLNTPIPIFGHFRRFSVISGDYKNVSRKILQFCEHDLSDKIAVFGGTDAYKTSKMVKNDLPISPFFSR